jgi:very-short-patch-repair endonuclease
MACKRDQALWDRAANQHGVVARRQLLALGFTRSAIEEGLAAGRLHRVEWRGVYSVGRPGLTRLGRLMAAVLVLGPLALISHESAAALWEIWTYRGHDITLSVPPVGQRHKRRGMTVHRRALEEDDYDHQRGIPVTSPIRTLIDMSARLNDRRAVERMIDQADAENLLRVPTLIAAVKGGNGERGISLLRSILEEDAFLLTDSELERLMVPIARSAGLGELQTGVDINGWKVDFYAPDLPLVIECMSRRYHRTPAQQRRDAERDQAHAAAGTPRVPYTHFQIAHDPGYVAANLRAIAAAIKRPARTPGRPRAL